MIIEMICRRRRSEIDYLTWEWIFEVNGIGNRVGLFLFKYDFFIISTPYSSTVDHLSNDDTLGVPLGTPVCFFVGSVYIVTGPFSFWILDIPLFKRDNTGLCALLRRVNLGCIQRLWNIPLCGIGDAIFIIVGRFDSPIFLSKLPTITNSNPILT